MNKVSNYQFKNPRLKIHSATGADDIVTGASQGIEDSISTLKKIGYENISYKEYDHMQHAILNEKDNHPPHHCVWRSIKACNLVA